MKKQQLFGTFSPHSGIDLFTRVYEFIHLDNTNPSKQGDLEGRVGGMQQSSL